MGLQEKDLRKREKIDALQLTSAEWDRIDTFLGLLAVRFPRESFYFDLTDLVP